MAGDSNRELRAFVDAWRDASARLDELRRTDLLEINVSERIVALNGAFEATLVNAPLRESSGLVEQQAVFSRIRNAGPVPPGG